MIKTDGVAVYVLLVRWTKYGKPVPKKQQWSSKGAKLRTIIDEMEKFERF
jgi:hypothetical protein